MEIRNALQKIENYLTVVSNLNKTILSEGTMSRDELLLMKKYLYTSIDRIEDIERLLIIDRKDEKSFTPTETIIESYVPPKAKEIVEVPENTHIEEAEATLSSPEILEVEAALEEIHAEIEKEESEVVGEIDQVKTPEENIEVEMLQAPVMEEEVEKEETQISTFEILPVIENIITEDFAVDNIITEDFAVDNIITEDFAVDELKQTELIPAPEIKAEEKPLVVNEVKEEVREIPFINKIEKDEETIAAKFGENKSLTFAEEMANKKSETSFFEQFKEKLATVTQPQLFEMFDDHKEELHETFSSPEPLTNNFEKNTGYANETVLVAEKEVETIVEHLTPSSLNDIFKPQTVVEKPQPILEKPVVVPEVKSQTVVENVNAKISKTFSESIALNDKFIFVRELFGNQFAEYENGLKQLDALSSFSAAESYCRENLWNKFKWNEKPVAVDRFMELLQKRFD
ncbi:MAG: hypothetical protein JWN78_1851 [Bacteroidota bacterium]|nr:hypothetical protein [Bacteroidota bacterium]